MLRDELKEMTFNYMEGNKDFKEEYDNIVIMLKNAAESGETYCRIKDISSCVLKKLHNEGIRWNTTQNINSVLYDLIWM